MRSLALCLARAHRRRVLAERHALLRCLQIEALEDRRLLTIDLVSIADPSLVAFPNFDSYQASISADGRYVAFESDATNLVDGDTNGARDVFLHDRTTGSTTRVSTDSGDRPSISADGRYIAFRSSLVSGYTNGGVFVKDLSTGNLAFASSDSAGNEGNNSSDAPSISADGRYVAFASDASNLVSDDSNGCEDIFVKDMMSGIITLASTDSAGNQGNDQSEHVSISADGRYVAFASWASNLVSGDTNGAFEVFVKDLATGVTTRASTDSAGGQANQYSYAPSISADGRYVAFGSYANNLVSDDTNGCEDLFVKDLVTGTITRGSTGSAGSQSNDQSEWASISADGRYVAFCSWASNLVSDDTNGCEDIFVKDLTTGITARASANSAGDQGNSYSYYPSISADGRHVAFESHANNLISGDTNGKLDIFAKDLATGQLNQASIATAGVWQSSNGGSGTGFTGSISADGRYVAFSSSADNLINGDTNRHFDVFVKDLSIGNVTRVSTDSAGNQRWEYSGGPSVSADWRYVAFTSFNNFVIGDNNYADDVFVKDLSTGQITIVSTDSGGWVGNSGSGWPSVSADGRYVAFHSPATNLVSGDTNECPDMFLKDRTTGSTRLVSADSAGNQGNGWSESPSMSADGRYVAFRSFASNLVNGDTNGVDDIFVKDMITGATMLVNTDSAGNTGDGGSEMGSISADGRYVVFQSGSTNLASGDTNGVWDVFVKDLTTGTTKLVSTDSAGNQGKGDSYYPSISADGRYVAFTSAADDFVSGSTNGFRQVFLKDLTTGHIARISSDSAGNEGNGDSQFPIVSADGQSVAFDSTATNLHPQKTTTLTDVFRWTNSDDTPPTVDIVDVTPDPRTTTVDTIAIVFSEPIAGFALDDLSLQRDGSDNLLTALQTLTSSDSITWELGTLAALTGSAGTYVLTLSAAGSGITDLSNNPLADDATDGWIVHSTIADRHIFYSHSLWDGNDGAANAFDDLAIATDKVTLLNGQKATFANYTNYSRGINGIMIDIVNLAEPDALSMADFEFRTGNNNNPVSWPSLAVDPSQITIAVRPGAGADGSDRVTIVFPDGAVKKTWLQVTVKATAATGLATPDVHYWGNAIGDSGNSASDTAVNVVDALGVRANPHTLLKPAPIDDAYDYNRDKQVNVQDELIVRANPTTLLTDLNLIDLSGYGGAGEGEGKWSGDAWATWTGSSLFEIPVPLDTSVARESLVVPSAAKIDLSRLTALTSMSATRSAATSLGVPSLREDLLHHEALDNMFTRWVAPSAIVSGSAQEPARSLAGSQDYDNKQFPAGPVSDERSRHPAQRFDRAPAALGQHPQRTLDEALQELLAEWEQF